MQRQHITRFTASVFNAITVVGFVFVLVGLPIAMISLVGWPGPTTLPEYEKVEAVLTGRQPVPPLFLIKVLALVAWVIWVQLVLAMVEEVQAIRLDLVAKKAFVLPGIQKFVASAVLAITLLVNGLKPASAATPSTPAPIAEPLRIDGFDERQAQHTEPEETKSYVTRAGDSWWKVAENFLGDGSRFSELRQLNVGTSFNGLIVQSDSDYLGIGWNIKLPADAKALTSIIVQPGDTLSELEEDHDLEPGELAEANDLGPSDTIDVGQRLNIPNRIAESLSPDHLEISEVQDDGSSRTPTTRSPVEEGQSSRSQERSEESMTPDISGSETLPPLQIQDSAPTQDQEASNLDDMSQVAGRAAVGGLLAAVALLAPALWSVRHRRFRDGLRTMTTDEPKLAPVGEASAAKIVAARSYGDDDFMAVLLQLLGQRMSSSRQDPGLLAIAMNDGVADLIFDQTPEFEPGPTFTTAGNRWRAERPASLDQLKSQASISAVPYPAMVSLGSLGDSSITINLEQLGGLNVIGTESEVREVMFHIAVQLATSNLAETIRVVVIGFGTSLSGLDRVEQYDVIPPELRVAAKVDEPGLRRLLTVDLASAQPVVVITAGSSATMQSFGAGVVPIVANHSRCDVAELVVAGPLLNVPRLGLNNVNRIQLSPREISDYLEPGVGRKEQNPADQSSTFPAPSTSSNVVDFELTVDLPEEPSVPLTAEAKPQSLAAPRYPFAVAAKETEPVALRPSNQTGTPSEQNPTQQNPTEHVSPVERSPIEASKLALSKQVVNDKSDRGGTSDKGGANNQDDTNIQGGRSAHNQGADALRPVSAGDLGFTFVVSVLGSIELDGVSLADPRKTWRYTKTAELVVLLATSKTPRTGDNIKELLWPGRDPLRCGPALANATSDARIRVVGESRFPKLAPGKTLYKVEGIGTDLDLFEENLNRAKESDSEALAMEYRRCALDLVRGLPFDSFAHKSSGYGWADALMMNATVQIVNVAVELSRWDLDRGRYDLAADVADKGLLASPENYELLYLLGTSSLVAHDHDRARDALAKIMDITNEYVEGTPGLSEPVLPTKLSDTQAALEKYLRYDSA